MNPLGVYLPREVYNAIPLSDIEDLKHLCRKDPDRHQAIIALSRDTRYDNKELKRRLMRDYLLPARRSKSSRPRLVLHKGKDDPQ